MMKRKLALLLAVLLIALAFTACNSDSGTTPPPTDDNSSGNEEPQSKKDTLNFMGKITSDTLDPASGGNMENNSMHAIFSTLIRYDPDGNLVPLLAEKYEEMPDGMGYVFTLRTDATFHDGTPVTADDVIYSFDAIADTSVNNAWIRTTYISGWEKVDETTINVYKKASYSEALNVLAQKMVVMPRALHEADPEAFAKNPVGSGPYRFVSQGVDGAITLAANEDYFLGAPAIKNVVIKAPLDISTAIVALENGELDIVTSIPTSQLPLLEQNDSIVTGTTESYSMAVVPLMTDTFSKDENLRKAVFHGINPENVIILANEGVGSPATDLYSKRVMGSFAGSVQMEGYNEDLAKEYLAKSSYNGETIKITVDSSNSNAAQAIMGDLKKIGITTEIEQLDMNAWFTKIMGGEVQMTATTLGSDMMSIPTLMAYWSKNDPNFGKYMASTDEFEQIMTELPTVDDPAKRDEMIVRTLQIQYELANIVPLYEQTINYAYTTDLTGIAPTWAATGTFYFDEVEPS